MAILSVFLSKLAIFVILTMAEPELLEKRLEIQDYTEYSYEWDSGFSSTGTDSPTSSESELTLAEGSDESFYSVTSTIADSYYSDVDEILQDIKNENQIISQGKCAFMRM